MVAKRLFLPGVLLAYGSIGVVPGKGNNPSQVVMEALCLYALGQDNGYMVATKR